MKENIKKILDIIADSKEHLTAEQIYMIMVERQYKVALATVYNNLKNLLNKGIIMKISVEGFPDRYDIATKHDHLVCKKCGRLSDIHLEDLTDILKKQVKTEIESYDLKICYICPQCKNKSKEDDNITDEK